MGRISLLHVTDLHYSSPNSNFGDDAKSYVPDPLRANYFRSLHEILEQCFQGTKLDAVALTGDFTTRGNALGFDDFEKRTLPKLKPLVSTPSALCMVPGNHDVVWDLDPTAPDYFDVKFRRYVESAKLAGATSCLVPTGGIPSTSSGEPDPFGELDFLSGSPLYVDNGVALLCINSSIRCGERNNRMRQDLLKPIKDATELLGKIDSDAQWKSNQGPVALSAARTYLNLIGPTIEKYTLFDVPHAMQTQMVRLRKALEAERLQDLSRWQSLVKVALLHHHVTPFDYQFPEHKAFEVMADASSLLALVASFGFNIVLTGHKHQPYIQRVQSQGRDLLVLGGSTVGGYTVTGFAPSVRYLEIDASEDHLDVAIAELPCNLSGDVSGKVASAIERARQTPVTVSTSAQAAVRGHRTMFPKIIETALELQLYGKNFYKTNVLFDVKVSNDGPASLTFETKMSYTVVNRTSINQEWLASYVFDHNNGSVVEIRLGTQPYDPNEAEFHTARGLTIRHLMRPQESLDFFVHMRERWPDRGSALYTSYHPATDLKLLLRSVPDDILVDFEILCSYQTYPVRRNDELEVQLMDGLLPNQGVKVNWKRKESANGKA